MKRKNLFIILFAVTLTFIGCSKKETPVMSNRVETETSTEFETTIENEEITEEVEEPTENIVEENITEEVENAEPTENDTEEMEGGATETELPADVDLEKEYEEPITEEVEPDYESMTQDERIDTATKNLVDDIINRYIQEQAQQNHVPVDDDDWGRVDDGTLANPKEYGKTSNPDLAGGNFN